MTRKIHLEQTHQMTLQLQSSREVASAMAAAVDVAAKAAAAGEREAAAALEQAQAVKKERDLLASQLEEAQSSRRFSQDGCSKGA